MNRFEKTKRIKSVEELLAVGNQKLHPIVYCERWDKTTPIAFLQNWQARLLSSWIRKGLFWHVRPKVMDKNGNEIKDGDSFLHDCINNGEPVRGKRIGDELIWEDGVRHGIDDFWSLDDSKDFERIED